MEFIKIKEEIIKNLEWENKVKSVNRPVERLNSILGSSNTEIQPLSESDVLEQSNRSGSRTKDIKNSIMMSSSRRRDGNDSDCSSTKSIIINQGSKKPGKMYETQKITISKKGKGEKGNEEQIIRQLRKEAIELDFKNKRLASELETVKK